MKRALACLTLAGFVAGCGPQAMLTTAHETMTPAGKAGYSASGVITYTYDTKLAEALVQNIMDNACAGKCPSANTLNRWNHL